MKKTIKLFPGVMNDVLRRLEQDCGYEDEIKAFLLDLGLDRSRGNQPGGYNLSGPQMDRVLRVSFNLTVNAHYTGCFFFGFSPGAVNEHFCTFCIALSPCPYYICFLRIGGKPDFIGRNHRRQRPRPWTRHRRLLPLPEEDE